MNIQLLIGSIVRQTTVLIAQLATSGGVRAPLAHIANQVFVELAHELESQGLNRKVAADMFGVSLRTYQRKIQRLKESSTDNGRSLWEAVIIDEDDREWCRCTADPTESETGSANCEELAARLGGEVVVLCPQYIDSFGTPDPP